MKQTRQTARAVHQAALLEMLESRRLMAVVINEVLASNTDGIRDQDGERSDWIELYNNGPSAVDLGGWSLTDDNAQLTKWQFPATILPQGGYLVVFASDKNRAVAGQELHTNFKLSSAGETLSLVQSDGTTIESTVTFGAQKDDKSYGRGVSASSTTNTTLIGNSSPLSVFVPNSANAARDDHWHEIGYNDAGWLTGTGSVGWDTNGSTAPEVDLSSFIGRTLTTSGGSPEVNVGSNFSIYVRYEFNAADPAQLTSLQMDLRFDDGFIAYLNGKQIARANFAEDFFYNQPQWNSYAGNQTTGSNSGAANRIAESNQLATWNLTHFLPFLVNGANVLTFHGVNSNSSGAPSNRQDFLIDPALTATRVSGPVSESFMVTPTPGSNNGVGTLGIVDDTHFSVDRGFYTSPQSLVISTTTPGASIRYTTDGSVPSATNGTLYSGPLNINETSIIRSIAYKEGWTPTDVDVQTYIFVDDVITQDASDVTLPYATWGHDKDTDGDATSGYNLDDESDWEMDPQIVSGNQTAVKNALTSIPSMSLVMDWDDLFSGTPDPGTFSGSGSVPPQTRGIYIMGRSKERYTSMEYMIPGAPLDGFHTDAAIEIQGHSSPTRWNSDKLSFQVSFKGPFGASSLNYPIFAGTPDGANAATHFDGLILDAMFNYSWLHSNVQQRDYARYVTDQAVADLQNIITGGAAPHGKYVHLYLNGLYWGLYNVHERPDDAFAAEYYGGEKEDYYVIKHAPQDIDGNKFTWVEGGLSAESAYTDLLNATRAVESNPANASLYDAVKGMLDVDHYIDYMIAHYYGGNDADWAHNNWYATFNHVDAGGRWRFHAWDNEHAYPTGDNGDAFDQTTNMTDKDDPNAPTEIFVNLMNNEEFRLKFADRVQALMYVNGPLTNTPARASYEFRTNEIDQAILAESARWGDNRVSNDPYTRSDFLSVKNAMLPVFFNARTTAVLGHFANVNISGSSSIKWIPTLKAPVYTNYGGAVDIGTSLTISKPAGAPAGAIIYYTTDGSDPRPGDGVPNGSIPNTTTSANLTINSSSRVKARIYFNNTGTANDWSPIIDATYIVGGSYPVRITELQYHPANHPALVDDEDAEYFELLNTGSTTVNLTGLQIADFATPAYTFGAGLTLNAGERIIVARNPTSFALVYGGGINVAPTGYGTANLSNGGEQVTLISPFGDTLQSFAYDDIAPWPLTPDGDGPSLEIIDPLGNPASAANWRASLGTFGSPGTDGLPLALDAAWRDVLVQFPANLSGVVDANDLQITPTGGGDAITPTAVTFLAGNQAHFTVATPFADGDYTGALSINGTSYGISFFTLTADANHDREVNTLDFTALASHFNQSTSVYGEGDFNNDGVVNALDFNALATKFGTQLAPAAIPAASPGFMLAGSSPSQSTPLRLLFGNQSIEDGGESEGADVL